MRYEDHVKRTGGAGEEIHRFLDQYFKLYGEDHRLILHHKLGLKVVAKKFGPEAIPIAEQHIRDDYDGELPDNYHDTTYFRIAWAYDMNKFREAMDLARNINGDIV